MARPALVTKTGAPNVATMRPPAVFGVRPMLSTIELLSMVTVPSVAKIPPPCHPVDVLPLIIVSTMVASPSVRSPPATPPATLPLIVLRVTLISLLKSP